MSDFDYDAELKRAQEAAVGLKRELEEGLLGRTHGPIIGAGTTFEESRIVRVRPAGTEQRYECQVTESMMWRVDMEATSGSGRGYGLGIEQFIPQEEIDEMFARHFAGIDGKRITKEFFAKARREGRDPCESIVRRILPRDD